MASDKDYQQLIYYVLSSFTKDGTPLEAIIGNKLEHQAAMFMAGMLANSNLVVKLSPEEMSDAAIHYAEIFQQKIGERHKAKIHNLERLIDK